MYLSDWIFIIIIIVSLNFRKYICPVVAMIGWWGPYCLENSEPGQGLWLLLKLWIAKMYMPHSHLYHSPISPVLPNYRVLEWLCFCWNIYCQKHLAFAEILDLRCYFFSAYSVKVLLERFIRIFVYLISWSYITTISWLFSHPISSLGFWSCWSCALDRGYRSCTRYSLSMMRLSSILPVIITKSILWSKRFINASILSFKVEPPFFSGKAFHPKSLSREFNVMSCLAEYSVDSGCSINSFVVTLPYLNLAVPSAPKNWSQT